MHVDDTDKTAKYHGDALTVGGTLGSQSSTTKDANTVFSVQSVPFLATTSIQKRVMFDESVSTWYFMVRKKMCHPDYDPPREFQRTWENEEKLFSWVRSRRRTS